MEPGHGEIKNMETDQEAVAFLKALNSVFKSEKNNSLEKPNSHVGDHAAILVDFEVMLK